MEIVRCTPEIMLTRGSGDTTLSIAEDTLNRIISIYPNPVTDEIAVTYELNKVTNASICISNYYRSGLPDTHILNVTSQTKIVDIRTYATGFYIVTLICDDKVADVKTFIKH